MKRVILGTTLSNGVDEQIGEYRIYSPVVRGNLYITQYNEYGETVWYVFEPNDSGPIPYYSVDDIVSDYRINKDNLINSYK